MIAMDELLKLRAKLISEHERNLASIDRSIEIWRQLNGDHQSTPSLASVTVRRGRRGEKVVTTTLPPVWPIPFEETVSQAETIRRAVMTQNGQFSVKDVVAKITADTSKAVPNRLVINQIFTLKKKGLVDVVRASKGHQPAIYEKKISGTGGASLPR